MWLVPLVPLIGGKRGVRAAALLLAILAVTQIFEPYRYDQYWHMRTPWLVWVVVARNLLVIGLLVLLVWPSERAETGGYTSAPRRP